MSFPAGAVTAVRAGAIHGHPGAYVLLVRDGRIVHVGGDIELAPAARTIDLRDCLLAPAFVDAHIHATSTGLALGGLDLSGTRDKADLLAAVAAAVTASQTVLGTGWDESRWADDSLPDAAELDRAAGSRRVYLSRVDVHSALVSSALLTLVDPAAAGYHPSGLLRRDAHHQARALAYGSISAAQRLAAQRRTRGAAAAAGIGCLHEMAGPQVSGEDDLRGLLQLAADEPGPDVVGYWGQLLDLATPARLGVQAGGDLFCDGAIGSHTAALREDYDDEPGNRGHLYHDAQGIAEHVTRCSQAGMQAGFHAIGDRALHAVAAGFTAAADRVGVAVLRRGRHRVEHAEMADPEVIATFARLGVVASVQPAFDAAWGGREGMYVRRLGPVRGMTLNPLADWQRAGVRLAFSSDSPVTPMDGWAAVRAAVEHRTTGAGITPPAAFRAATAGGFQAARDDASASFGVAAPATFAAWSLPGSSRPPDLAALAGTSTDTPICRLSMVRGHVIHSC